MTRTLVLAFFPCAALAVPTQLTHQGRLLDAAGQPLEGQHQITLRLRDAQGVEQWIEAETVTAENGYYSVTLGDDSALDSALLDQDLWLGIELAGTEHLEPLTAVPYAILAHSVSATGQVPWAAVQAPADLADGDDDTLAGLTCGDGQILQQTAGGWACANHTETDPSFNAWLATGAVGAAVTDTGADQRICTGHTPRDGTGWLDYSNGAGIYRTVDISGCGFSSPPVIVTSLSGIGSHWVLTGPSSTYNVSATQFTIFLRYADGTAPTVGFAENRRWAVEWIAIGT